MIDQKTRDNNSMRKTTQVNLMGNLLEFHNASYFMSVYSDLDAMDEGKYDSIYSQRIS
jgi:hypothetical protein